MHELMFWPHKKAGESLSGYLSRVSEYNEIESVDRFLHYFGAENSDPAGEMHLEFRIRNLTSLATLLRTDVDTLQPHPRILLNGSYRDGLIAYLGRVWSTGMFRLSIRAWCPKCLVEHEMDRELWQFVFVNACPEHKCLLVNRCHECGSTASWRYGTWRHCKCGADLGTGPVTAVEGPHGFVDEVVLYDPQRLVDFLMVVMLFGDTSSERLYLRRLASMPVADAFELLRPAIKALHQHPDALAAFTAGIKYRRERFPALGPRYAVVPLLIGISTGVKDQLRFAQVASQFLEADTDGTELTSTILQDQESTMSRREVLATLNTQIPAVDYLVKKGILSTANPREMLLGPSSKLDQLVTVRSLALFMDRLRSPPQMREDCLQVDFLSPNLQFRLQYELLDELIDGRASISRYDEKVGLPSLQVQI